MEQRLRCPSMDLSFPCLSRKLASPAAPGSAFFKRFPLYFDYDPILGVYQVKQGKENPYEPSGLLVLVAINSSSIELRGCVSVSFHPPMMWTRAIAFMIPARSRPESIHSGQRGKFVTQIIL